MFHVHDPFKELTVQLVGTPTPTNATVTLVSASDGSFYFEPAGAERQWFWCSLPVPCLRQRRCWPGLAAACSAAVTATFNITGPDLWFIDDTDAAGCGVNCNGTRSKPLVGFNNAALTGRGNGDRIFVFTGTYGTGLTLFTNEHLIGQGHPAPSIRARCDGARQRYARYQTRARRHPTTVERHGHGRGKQPVRGLNIVTTARPASPAARSRA